MTRTVEIKRDCDAVAVPSGRRETLPAGTALRVLRSRDGNYTVSTQIHALYRIDGKDADALGIDAKSESEPEPKELTEQLVWDALRKVYDPELPVNIVDLGLIYSCTIAPASQSGKIVAIRMAVTSPGCGMSNVLKSDVEQRLMRLPEVAEARVEVVFDPPWSPERMSEAARLQLNLESQAGPGLTQIAGMRGPAR